MVIKMKKRKLKDISVRMKIMGPVILIAILMIVISLVNNDGMRDIMTETRDISNDHAMSIMYIGDIAKDFENLQRIANAHILAPDDATMRKLEAEVDEAYADITEAITESEKVFQSARTVGAVVLVIGLIFSLITIYTCIIELVKPIENMNHKLNENVLPDYDRFVASGKQYRDDSVHVNEVVSQFNDMAGNLNTIVSEITDSIQTITTAIEESTNAVTMAAVNTNELVDEIGQISTQMESNNAIAGKLKSEADRFVSL